MNSKITVLKALADEARLNIIDMLSCGEMCAYDIMNNLELTQPTISHHLKILVKAELVTFEKNGKWRIYSLVTKEFDEITSYINLISNPKDNCRCYEFNNTCQISK